jgi:hypothetical protein
VTENYGINKNSISSLQEELEAQLLLDQQQQAISTPVKIPALYDHSHISDKIKR